jgi:hypothetical protein
MAVCQDVHCLIPVGVVWGKEDIQFVGGSVAPHRVHNLDRDALPFEKPCHLFLAVNEGA